MKKVKEIAWKAANASWFYPLVLLLVGLVTYELMVTRLGFYWDDWEDVYLYYLHNPSIIFQYFNKRPLSTLPYLPLFATTPMNPVIWQLASLLVRWVGILFFYWTLNALWPASKGLNRWVGILLLVFPGFISQSVAICYIRHFTSFALFTCSLFLTVQALRDRKRFWLWMSLSLVLGIVQFLIVEYFALLEITRLLVIWFVIRPENCEKWTRSLRKSFLYWSPFLIALVIFICWRLLPHSTVATGDPNNPTLLKALFSSPLETINTYTKMALQAFGYLVFSVWFNAFSVDAIDFRSKTTWFSWIIGLSVAIPFTFYIFKTSDSEKVKQQQSLIQRVVLGVMALVAGAIPVWSTGRYVLAGKWSDRFTLAPMLGAVILIVCLLDWLVKTHYQKNCLLLVLLASSISFQIYNVNKFRLDWENQRNLYWQLSWRIPKLESGTAIIGAGTFTAKSSYYDARYIVNLIFSDDPSMGAQYDYFDPYHLSSESLKPNMPLVDNVREEEFVGNTSRSIGMFFDIDNPQKCVRILDSSYSKDPEFDENINKLLRLSNLDLIQTGGDSHPLNTDTFGTEPAHTWCYYFEKADLARQAQDWATVLELGSTARSNGFTPTVGSEYLPFIEAYAQKGNWSQAFNLSVSAQQLTQGLEPLLCNNWTRFASFSSASSAADFLSKAQLQFCTSADQ
jgi:hypothetical protein